MRFTKRTLKTLPRSLKRHLPEYKNRQRGADDQTQQYTETHHAVVCENVEISRERTGIFRKQAQSHSPESFICVYSRNHGKQCRKQTSLGRKFSRGRNKDGQSADSEGSQQRGGYYRHAVSRIHQNESKRMASRRDQRAISIRPLRRPAYSSESDSGYRRKQCILKNFTIHNTQNFKFSFKTSPHS